MLATISALTKLRPLLAGALGLGLGLAGQAVFRHGRGDAETSAAGQTAAGAVDSVRPAPQRAVPSPTATLLGQLANATTADCEDRVRALGAALPNSTGLELELVFRRWLELEQPEVLLKRIPELLGKPSSTDWRGPFFKAWTAQDYPGAMARTKDLPEFAAARALAAITARDPDFLACLTFGSGVSNALRTLGREDPELARSVTAWNSADPGKTAAIQSVAAGMASRNPEAAWEWVRSLGLAGQPNERACSMVLAEWLKTDATAAIAACQASGLDPSKFSLRDAGPADTLPGSNALRALMYPGTASGQLYLAIHQNPFLDVTGLYQALSAAKIDWSKPQGSVPAIDHDGWYCPDPAAAAKQAEQLPPGKARDCIFDNINRQWFARDPEAATAFAATHGLSKLPDRFTTDSRPIDPQTVREAAAAPQETFAELLKPAVEVTPGTNPEKLYNLAMAWSASDPPAVAEWLIEQAAVVDSSHTATSQLALLFSNTLGYHWAQRDAVGATAWVESLPDGPLKARAWGAMYDRVESYSPDLAFEHSAALLQGGSRLPLLKSSLLAVSEKIGEGAAAELLQSPDLTAAERVSLTAALEAAKNPPAPTPP
jgi:hypothetical protein